MNLQKSHLVIVRTGASVLNLGSYNCQEIGLAKALCARGLRTTVVLAGYSRSDSMHGPVRVITLPFRAINQSVGRFTGLEATLDDLRPTVLQIHEFEMTMSLAAARWANRHRIPVVMIQGAYEHSRNPVKRAVQKILAATVGRSVLRRIDGIGVKTERAGRYIESFTGKPWKLTPIGLDEEKFIDPEPLPAELKAAVASGRKLLLYVGVMEARRHPLLLPEILAKLPPDYMFVAVGKGPLAAELKNKVMKSGVADRTLLLPALPQKALPALYRAASLFLLPSDYEIYGMVLLEALYFGLPAVAYTTAGADFLIDDACGRVMRSFDAAEWARTIEELTGSPQRLAEMREAASRKIRGRFTWHKVADDYIDLYSGCVC